MNSSTKNNRTALLACVAFTLLVAAVATFVSKQDERPADIPTPLQVQVKAEKAALNHFVSQAMSQKNRMYAKDMDDGKKAAFATDRKAFIAEVMTQYYPGERTFYLERDVGLADLKDLHLRQARQYHWAAYANILDILIGPNTSDTPDPSNKYEVKAGQCTENNCFLIVTIPTNLPMK